MLTVALVFGLLGASCGVKAGEKPMPQWDGKESIADYAKRMGAEPTLTLDLRGGVKVELVLIPAGKFMMGSPENEKDRNKDEGPQHEVTISQAFYMGKFVVTQEQGQAIMGDNPSHFQGANNPVTNVSWNDAQHFFCRKLTTTSGKKVRLPTEAEWEYACRAGSTTPYSFGDSENGLADYAWYKSNSDDKMHPVGEKKPNAWGLYDVHGNVGQWCQDRAAYYASGAATDPTGPATGAGRVIRGSSFNDLATACRSARRGYPLADRQFNTDGFRVVVDASRNP